MDPRGGLHEDDIDDVLARVQEESLRHYREVELRKFNGASTVESSRVQNKEDIPSSKQTSPNLNRSNILCSQVGGKAGAFLYDGEGANGFHLDSGKTYIYPTNYPIRSYQSSMVRSALFANTLISLPTGLGKTFIAAVVMYNFYRWYPFGKIVFMAPTRPLVAQQIKACYDVMGIPKDDTIEMTGHLSTEVRKDLWKSHRVFFLTPQVMANDLRSKICPPELVKCVVVDEAHKAIGEFAYCQVINQLLEVNPNFRILALSATPGKDINTVQQVIRNLNISRLEIRGEDSIDIQQYIFHKLIQSKVVEPSKEMIFTKRDFLEIFEKYAKRLKELKALPNNVSFMSKFQVMKEMEKFRARPPPNLPQTMIGSLIGDFSVCMVLAHALDLLQTYGLRALYNYFSGDGVGSEKNKASDARLKKDEDLKEMLHRLRRMLYPPPELEGQYVWSHPKLYQLVTLLDEHFSSSEPTRAIVFCQFRVVVMEIVELLNDGQRRYKAAEFIGQSGGKERGMAQSKQIQIMQEFREGKIQVLVATCVAEEGLDIGEVDLIILMEAQSSPVRFVQRLGRTGRKRKGKCVVLLSKGKEEQKFKDAMATRKSYVATITKSSEVQKALNPCTPSMFPPGVKPEKENVHIKIDSSVPEKVIKPIKKQTDVRDFLAAVESPYLTNEELRKVKLDIGKPKLEFNQIPKRMELWHRCFDQKKMSVDEFLNKDVSCWSDWNDWFAEDQRTFKISHSSLTSTLRDLLNFKPRLGNLEDKMTGFDATVSPRKEKQAKGSPSTSPCKVPEDNAPKKVRKKKEPVKVLNMDIRQCLAKAKTRQKPVTQRSNFDADDVVTIDDSGVPPIRFPHVANIFNLKAEDFEILLKNEFECEFDRKNDMCSRLAKYSLSGEKVEWASVRPFVSDFADLGRARSDGKEAKDVSQEKNPPGNDQNDFANFDDLFDDDFALPHDLFEIEKRGMDLIRRNDEHHLPGPTIQGGELKRRECEVPRSFAQSPISRTPVAALTQGNAAFKLVDASPSTSAKILENRIQFDTVVASTPIHPAEKVNETDSEWNLSDLFEEDEEQEPGSVDRSSRMGITQMVREIEKNKKIPNNVSISFASSKIAEESDDQIRNFKAFKPKQRLATQASTAVSPSGPIKMRSLSKRKLSFDKSASPKLTPLCKKRKLRELDDDEDDDLIIPSFTKRPVSSSGTSASGSVTVNVVKKRKPKKADDYIEREADVSGDLTEDDSDNSSLDQLDDSFINDESVQDASMRNYLESVRNRPVNGQFKLNPRNNANNFVYSQRIDDDYVGEYENDSFCVDSEGESLATSPSLLDEAEKALERRKRLKDTPSSTSSRRSSNRWSPAVTRKKKRRRIITSDSEGDSPEKPSPIPVDKEKDVIVLSDDSAGGGDLSESEKQFQSDLQKAIYQSQIEVRKPNFSKLPTAKETNGVNNRKLKKIEELNSKFSHVFRKYSTS